MSCSSYFCRNYQAAKLSIYLLLHSNSPCDCPIRLNNIKLSLVGRTRELNATKIIPSPAREPSARTISQGMRIWSLSVSRLWMTVTAAFPSIVLSSKSWKRQSARVRLTALWSRISAASQETTSTADVTLRRYSRSSAYASSQSMMRMTV